jgi:hypothetical protein
MTEAEVIAELVEMAQSHWMIARHPETWCRDRQDHERQAEVLEAAVELIRLKTHFCP